MYICVRVCVYVRASVYAFVLRRFFSRSFFCVCTEENQYCAYWVFRLLLQYYCTGTSGGWGNLCDGYCIKCILHYWWGEQATSSQKKFKRKFCPLHTHIRTHTRAHRHTDVDRKKQKQKRERTKQPFHLLSCCDVVVFSARFHLCHLFLSSIPPSGYTARKSHISICHHNLVTSKVLTTPFFSVCAPTSCFRF